jgi:hypothetical protein
VSCRRTVALALQFVVAAIAGAQSAPKDQGLAQRMQVRGYRADTSTGLMWTAKDSGHDIRWHQAVKYCRKLRLREYSDRGLPTIDELHAVYDGSGFDVLPQHKGDVPTRAGKARGGLFLTGPYEWSSSRVFIDQHRAGYAWQFDFPGGERRYGPLGYDQRALCVRQAER